MVGPLRGGGVKLPKPTFFLNLQESHKTRDKLIKQNCMLCTVLVNNDQHKKIGLTFFLLIFYLFSSENIVKKGF